MLAIIIFSVAAQNPSGLSPIWEASNVPPAKPQSPEDVSMVLIGPDTEKGIIYDVYIIGEASAGVNIITEEIVSPYGFTINPATAFAYSANGDKLSEEGVKTDFLFDELEQKNNIYPLGDKQEYLLYNTFYIIEYGISATSHITN